MALFVDFSRSPDFLHDAFTVYVDDLQIVTATAIRVELRNPYSGVTTILTGTGLAGPVVNGTPTIAGTMTGFEIRVPDGTGDAVTFQASGIAWGAVEFLGAARDAAMPGDGDFTRLDALFSLQPITYDARSAVNGVAQGFWGATSAITMVGSDFADTLLGGAGNDIIDPGLSPGIEVIIASRGSDTVDLRRLGPDSWAALDYGYMDGPVQILLDGGADTGRVTKTGVGTDTILGVRHTMEALSFDLYGTSDNDSFTLKTVATGGSFLYAAGGPGNDTFDLTLNSTIRLGYGGGGGGTGIVANLATGVITDGLGGTDRISIRGGTVALELSASNFDDMVTGSSRGEVIFAAGGDDTVLAGAGNDTLYGGGGSDELSGEAGDDVLQRGEGGSKLYGGEGNDTIHSNGGEQVFGGAGDDWVLIGDPIGGAYIDPGPGLDTVDFTAPGDPTDLYPNRTGLLYHSLAGRSGIAVLIDGSGAGASGITSSLGRTDLRNVGNALSSKGLLLFATSLGDSFDLTLGKGQSLEVITGMGQDTIRATGTGSLTIQYEYDPDSNTLATQGMVANLATGVVSNDGFGTVDMLDIGAGIDLAILTTRLADRITGGAGNDRIILDGGNDTLQGGGGSDTLDWSIHSYGAAVRVDLAAGTATGVWTGVNSKLTFAGFENVVGSESSDVIFGDRGANVLDGGRFGNDRIYGDGYRAGYDMFSAEMVYRFYRAMLDREPDAAGHAFWAEQLATRTATVTGIANNFLASREFQNTYGALDDVAFVTQLYRNVLGREPDAQGLANWLGRIAGGTSRADVAAGFANSQEFTAATDTKARSFAESGIETDWVHTLYGLYRVTLDRAPDLVGYLDWQARMASGTPYLTVVEGFVGSREFQRAYGPLDNTAFVTQLYRNVLDREPDAAGLFNWLWRLENNDATRAQVVAGFGGSAEFARSVAVEAKEFIRAQGGGDRIIGGPGSDKLWGGTLADTFVFSTPNPGTRATDEVMDTEIWDFLEFRGFGYATAADARAHMKDFFGVLFEDQGVRIQLNSITLADLTDDMFILL